MFLLIAVHTVFLVQYAHGGVHVHEGVPVRSVPGVLQVKEFKGYHCELYVAIPKLHLQSFETPLKHQRFS